MKTIIQVILFLLPSVTLGASFDCSKATTNTELAICENPQLSILDEMMALSYRQLMKEISDKKSLKNEQLAFLAKNKQCNGNLDCLKQNYIIRTIEVNTQSIDLRNFLENKKWSSLSGICGSKTGGFSFQKGGEIITLIMGCGAENKGILYDIEVGSSSQINSQTLNGNSNTYRKGNNKIKINIASKSPQIIYLSVNLDSNGQCVEGTIDCWLDQGFYTIKTPFGYQALRQQNEIYNEPCVINIEVIRQKLKVTYINGDCGTGSGNRHMLQDIDGIYSSK